MKTLFSMRKSRKEKRGYKYENRLFGLLFLVAAVPLIIAGAVSYGIYVNEITKQSDLAMETVRIQMQKDIEGVLTNMKSYYLETAGGKEFEWLSTTPGVPYTQYSNLEESQDVLRGPFNLNGYVKGYAFINAEQDWVLTNNGMFRISETQNAEQVFDFLEEVEKNPSTMFWQNNMDVPEPYEDGLYRSNTLDLSGYLLVLKPEKTGKQLLLVSLNISALDQTIKVVQGEYAVCILEKTGLPLYSSDPELGEYCQSHQGKGLATEKMPLNIELSDGRKYRIHVTDSTSNGMHYVIGYDLKQVQQGGSKMIVVSIVALGTVLALFGVCRAMAAVLYRPVKRLTDYVADVIEEPQQLQKSDSETADDKEDEFTSIRRNLGQLVNSREDLQQMVRRQQKLLREQFLIRVIRGEMTAEEVKNGLMQFRLKRTKEYRLLAAVCVMEDETDPDSFLETEALNMRITEKIPADITEDLVAPPFSYNTQILLIVGGENNGELTERVKSIWSRFTEYVDECFGYTAIAGASQIFPALKYLRVAYNECSEMLRNTENAEDNSLAFYENITRDDAIISGYDFVIENALVKAVDTGAAQEAEELIDKFVNSLNNRGISGYDRSYCLYRLVVAVLSVISNAGLNTNQVFGGDELAEDVFKNVGDIYEADKLKEYLCSRIVLPAIEALKEYRFAASTDILRSIMSLVKERGGDITLAECAEKLNYHPSYIWKVLKAERNMTFTDLVNSEKLARAKQMLLNTDCSVAEIAEKLNYSNTQNFIRFFGKYMQTTPKKYREEHQKKER